MEDEIRGVLLAGSVAAIGWLVTHVLSVWREDVNRSRDALLRHTEKQLEELYGPLVFLVYEGRQTWNELTEVLGRKTVFRGGVALSEEDLKVWRFWMDNDFRPRNQSMKSLLVAKTHLIEGSEMPKSFIEFLNHANSWDLNHLRWESQEVAYSWHSRVNWPMQFEDDVISTFRKLQRRHGRLVSSLSSERVSIAWIGFLALVSMALFYIFRSELLFGS